MEDNINQKENNIFWRDKSLKNCTIKELEEEWISRKLEINKLYESLEKKLEKKLENKFITFQAKVIEIEPNEKRFKVEPLPNIEDSYYKFCKIFGKILGSSYSFAGWNTYYMHTNISKKDYPEVGDIVEIRTRKFPYMSHLAKDTYFNFSNLYMRLHNQNKIYKKTGYYLDDHCIYWLITRVVKRK